MEFYTLGSNFLRSGVVDTFLSAIWTERYTKPGDVSLVVDPTPQMISQLSEGTFLALDGTDEVMILDTQSIEDGKLTVTGSSLLGFLDERILFSMDPLEIYKQILLVSGKKPGELIEYIVDTMAINVFPSLPLDEIPNLTIGAIDTSDPIIPNMALSYGSVLNSIVSIAEEYSLGMSLYLDSPPNLKFKVYKGLDLSNSVLFSPELDSLTNIKELKSTKGYKTVAYGWTITEPNFGWFGIVEAYPGANSESGFDRRLLLVFVDNVSLKSTGAVDPDIPTTPELNVFYNAAEAIVKNVLANNNYTKVVDGEVVPQPQFQFGVHYNLGDIVQLQGHSEIVQNARITEYIRSQDATGERAYPTVSVID